MNVVAAYVRRIFVNVTGSRSKSQNKDKTKNKDAARDAEVVTRDSTIWSGAEDDTDDDDDYPEVFDDGPPACRNNDIDSLQQGECIKIFPSSTGSSSQISWTDDGAGIVDLIPTCRKVSVVSTIPSDVDQDDWTWGASGRKHSVFSDSNYTDAYSEGCSRKLSLVSALSDTDFLFEDAHGELDVPFSHESAALTSGVFTDQRANITKSRGDKDMHTTEEKGQARHTTCLMEVASKQVDTVEHMEADETVEFNVTEVELSKHNSATVRQEIDRLGEVNGEKHPIHREYPYENNRDKNKDNSLDESLFKHLSKHSGDETGFSTVSQAVNVIQSSVSDSNCSSALDKLTEFADLELSTEDAVSSKHILPSGLNASHINNNVIERLGTTAEISSIYHLPTDSIEPFPKQTIIEVNQSITQPESSSNSRQEPITTTTIHSQQDEKPCVTSLGIDSPKNQLYPADDESNLGVANKSNSPLANQLADEHSSTNSELIIPPDLTQQSLPFNQNDIIKEKSTNNITANQSTNKLVDVLWKTLVNHLPLKENVDHYAVSQTNSNNHSDIDVDNRLHNSECKQIVEHDKQEIISSVTIVDESKCAADEMLSLETSFPKECHSEPMSKEIHSRRHIEQRDEEVDARHHIEQKSKECDAPKHHNELMCEDIDSRHFMGRCVDEFNLKLVIKESSDDKNVIKCDKPACDINEIVKDCDKDSSDKAKIVATEAAINNDDKSTDYDVDIRHHLGTCDDKSSNADDKTFSKATLTPGKTDGQTNIGTEGKTLSDDVVGVLFLEAPADNLPDVTYTNSNTESSLPATTSCETESPRQSSMMSVKSTKQTDNQQKAKVCLEEAKSVHSELLHIEIKVRETESIPPEIETQTTDHEINLCESGVIAGQRQVKSTGNQAKYETEMNSTECGAKLSDLEMESKYKIKRTELEMQPIEDVKIVEECSILQESRTPPCCKIDSKNYASKAPHIKIESELKETRLQTDKCETKYTESGLKINSGDKKLHESIMDSEVQGKMTLHDVPSSCCEEETDIEMISEMKFKLQEDEMKSDFGVQLSENRVEPRESQNQSQEIKKFKTVDAPDKHCLEICEREESWRTQVAGLTGDDILTPLDMNTSGTKLSKSAFDPAAGMTSYNGTEDASMSLDKAVEVVQCLEKSLNHDGKLSFRSENQCETSVTDPCDICTVSVSEHRDHCAISVSEPRDHLTVPTSEPCDRCESYYTLGIPLSSSGSDIGTTTGEAKTKSAAFHEAKAFHDDDDDDDIIEVDEVIGGSGESDGSEDGDDIIFVNFVSSNPGAVDLIPLDANRPFASRKPELDYTCFFDDQPVEDEDEDDGGSSSYGSSEEEEDSSDEEFVNVLKNSKFKVLPVLPVIYEDDLEPHHCGDSSDQDPELFEDALSPIIVNEANFMSERFKDYLIISSLVGNRQSDIHVEEEKSDQIVELPSKLNAGDSGTANCPKGGHSWTVDAPNSCPTNGLKVRHPLTTYALDEGRMYDHMTSKLLTICSWLKMSRDVYRHLPETRLLPVVRAQCRHLALCPGKNLSPVAGRILSRSALSHVLCILDQSAYLLSTMSLTPPPSFPNIPTVLTSLLSCCSLCLRGYYVFGFGSLRLQCMKASFSLSLASHQLGLAKSPDVDRQIADGQLLGYLQLLSGSATS
ncbi:hypothetical protein Btru_053430 [Bulinus truncatus]|nr:hypothetical protein Btru_053430 [Bulinus truncatus]